MKLISYVHLGEARFGAAVEGGIVDLTGLGGVETLREAIAADMAEEIADYLEGRAAELSFSNVTFLPVIPDPAKVLCIGVNYAEHKAETGRPDVEHPTVFTRFADTLLGHRQPLVKPHFSNRFDLEGELAVIVGRGGRNIPEDRALEHVAGYACFNDGSVRDWQRHTGQFTPGKNFPASGGFGPWMLTADEVEDYRTLPITSRLNGKVMQEATLADLIFPLERLIAYCSTFTALAPGDVIATGTPGGVGDKRVPPVYMGPGDLAEVDLGPVGTLVNPVIGEDDL
ncbi:fumarylacetoacetate hydrolase family protein [Psychromarinibacter sp. C21-152]|uniref:Fumarylacetoacetate hydrolase family protein n=1 Tax=Psychromarinibacter sediminicola TaxID=3033385 RepID=A0AAE3NTG0_9RHOB|nr:fumarylacetoacetate hydrolase family protein [Psychromarinibacter sediminicola]MDF0601752.1 fumarylacetoacetate hydrolase family protein [Psychromarinibacter sediminicola]